MAYPLYILTDSPYINSQVKGQSFTNLESLLQNNQFSEQQSRKIIYRILCQDEKERDEILEILSKHEEVNLKKYSSSVCILMPGENSLEFTRLSQGKDILWGKDFEEAMQGKAEKAIHVLQQYHRPIGWDVISAIIIANAADPILQNSVDYWLEKRQLSLHRMALRHEGLARIIFTTGLAKQVTGEELGALVKKHSQLYRELAESGQLDSNAILDRRLHLQISEKIQNDSVLGKKPVVITHVQMVHDAISEDFYSIWEASEDKNKSILN